MKDCQKTLDNYLTTLKMNEANGRHLDPFTLMGTCNLQWSGDSASIDEKEK